jgi:hypothetical protein
MRLAEAVDVLVAGGRGPERCGRLRGPVVAAAHWHGDAVLRGEHIRGQVAAVELVVWSLRQLTMTSVACPPARRRRCATDRRRWCPTAGRAGRCFGASRTEAGYS